LWALKVSLEGNKWTNGEQVLLWNGSGGELTGTQKSMAANFAALRFGAPCITLLGPNRYHVAFWCYEDCIGIIRGFTFGFEELQPTRDTSRLNQGKAW
jgi:sialidase-1